MPWNKGLLMAGIAVALPLSFAPPSHSQSSSPPARFVVVLDAAHGGDDTGGRLDPDHLEKDFTLAMSVRLRSLLGARGMQVVTTREQDATVDDNRRAEIANHANAQACLSLHASASGRGVHLYISSLAPASGARFNAWRTAQAAWVSRSLALAGVINGDLKQAEVPVIVGRMTLPVLDSMACPAVAVEIAPMGNGSQNAGDGLDNADYQAKVAGALAAALLEWRSESGQTGAHQP
jgi:N-acetylmuramoyl-L-alanine amidase